MSRQSLPRLGLAVTFVALALAFAAGCEKKTSAPGMGGAPPGSSNSPGAGGVAASPGRVVFDSQGCARCHTLGSPEMIGREPVKTKGPDLAKVGADPKHTKEWLASYIRNPKMVNPASQMPPFGAKITEVDLNNLTDYLASLK